MWLVNLYWVFSLFFLGVFLGGLRFFGKGVATGEGECQRGVGTRLFFDRLHSSCRAWQYADPGGRSGAGRWAV
ncbi:MAG: hypothetical protein RLZZ485_889, partial [Actinomycetota bacterium]